MLESIQQLWSSAVDPSEQNAYKINIESVDPTKDLSMREVYGLDKRLSE